MQFPRTNSSNNGIRIIRSDQGNEPTKSTTFRDTAHLTESSVESMDADNSSQNHFTERLLQTIRNMIRTRLENAGLYLNFGVMHFSIHFPLNTEFRIRYLMPNAVPANI